VSGKGDVSKPVQ